MGGDNRGKKGKGHQGTCIKDPGVEWGLTVVRELGGAGESNRGKGGTTLIEQQLKAIIPSFKACCS